VKKNARVLQLLFFKMGKEVEEGYSGIYQNENIKKIINCCTVTVKYTRRLNYDHARKERLACQRKYQDACEPDRFLHT